MRLLNILILFITLCFNANAANISTGVVQGKVAYIKLQGSITAKDDSKFMNAVNQLQRSGYKVSYLFLSSGGGLLKESYYITKWVQANKITTVVPAGSQCASACFNIFAAGSTKMLYPDSKLGVHRVSSGGKDNDSARSTSIDMDKLYKKLGVPSNISYKMLTTPPEKMYWLTKNDHASLKVQYLKSNDSSQLGKLGKTVVAKNTPTPPVKNTPTKVVKNTPTKKTVVQTRQVRIHTQSTIIMGGKTIPINKSGVYQTGNGGRVRVVVIGNNR